MGIITKSARKYKYILNKGSKNYNPFFDGTVWTAENIDGLDDYVRLSSVERSETENSSAVSKKIITIPKTRLMSDFTKVCKQDIQPEFKKNDAANETMKRNESWFEPNPFDDVPTHEKLVETAAPDNVDIWTSLDLATDDDGECAWWSNGEIEKFMQNYDVDHSLLWTDNDIRKYMKNPKKFNKCDNPKKEPEDPRYRDSDKDKCYASHGVHNECASDCSDKKVPCRRKCGHFGYRDDIRPLLDDALSLLHEVLNRWDW